MADKVTSFSTMFIQDVERSEGPAIIGSMMYKVIRPNMVAILGLQTDARSIVQPEPPLLRLFHWHFEPLTPPQTFDTFVIYLPARVSQKGGNPTVAISTVLPCQLNHVRNQTLLVSPPLWQSTLCGSVLT